MYSILPTNCLSSVYRLEEDGSVLKEGGVRLSLLVLRACSYKTKAEAWQQGNAPSSSRGGFRFLLIVITQMNTDILVDNQRNQRNLRENSICQSNGIISV